MEGALMNTRVADQRILRGSVATIESRKLDGNGEPTAASGAVTVVVTSADGTAVQASTAATADTVTTGRFTYALTAAQTANLNLLTCVWTDAGDSSTWTTYVEVVGAFYFSIGEARASDQSLENASKYSDELILRVRREVEDEFEAICGVAFVPRYARLTLDGYGTGILMAPIRTRSVRSVWNYTDWSTPTYTAYTATELADLVVGDSGIVTRSDGGAFVYGVGNHVVEVEHGYDRPPAEVKRAALTRLRHRLNQTTSAIPDRATQFTVVEGGTFRLDSAGANKTGLPEVDAVLARYSHHVPSIA